MQFFLLPLEIRYIDPLPSLEQTADALGLVISLIFILTISYEHSTLFYKGV
jgi:hypothetical protein